MAKLTATTYQSLVNLHHRRSKSTVRIGNNTISEFDGDEVVIRLHGHEIITLHHTGLVRFSLAGFPTVTTRDRINQFLPAGFRLYQSNWEQLVSNPAGEVIRCNRGWTECHPVKEVG